MLIKAKARFPALRTQRNARNARLASMRKVLREKRSERNVRKKWPTIRLEFVT